MAQQTGRWSELNNRAEVTALEAGMDFRRPEYRQLDLSEAASLLGLLGVYAFLNVATGRRYVGSSSNVGARLQHHIANLRGGRHGNDRLQKSWNARGADSFRLELLEVVNDPPGLLAVEQRWIDAFADTYNFIEAGAVPSTLGLRHSEETKALLREQKLGTHFHTSESKRKIGDARRGKRQPAAAVAATTSKIRGLKRSEAAKDNYRRSWTPERRAAQREVALRVVRAQQAARAAEGRQ